MAVAKGQADRNRVEQRERRAVFDRAGADRFVRVGEAGSRVPVGMHFVFGRRGEDRAHDCVRVRREQRAAAENGVVEMG